MKYVYPAVFTEEKTGGYSVSFPDLKSCYTCGDNLQHALYMAQDVLCLSLYDMELAGKAIPAPSELKNIVTESDAFVSLVSCDTVEYRKFYDKKAIKKTLSIPAWLNTMAEQENINFSQTLQDALKKQLNV